MHARCCAEQVLHHLPCIRLLVAAFMRDPSPKLTPLWYQRVHESKIAYLVIVINATATAATATAAIVTVLLWLMLLRVLLLQFDSAISHLKFARGVGENVRTGDDLRVS
jgi:hypothetical protein